MKSSVRNNIRRWLIFARGKFSPPFAERAKLVMRRVIIVLLFLPILLAAPACKQPTAPDPKPEFSFTIEDASCTEAWLNVKTANFGSGFSFALNRNDSTIWRFAALPPDTIIVDEGLLPNKEYTYELLAISSKTAPISAGKKKVTTMDTTSHNFTWQTWEFGDIGSSVLYDVAIIDENNIWAVGEISIRDSSHNGYTTYNAVHWDGVKWELKRILFPTVCGSTDRTAFPSRSIIYLQNGIIWAGSSGDKIAVMKDNIQVNQFCLPTSLQMGINKMWGTSDKDVYAVGNSGNIAHYDGVSWKKIESGTDIPFLDIKGSVSDDNANSEVYVIGSEYISSRPSEIFKLENNRTAKVTINGLTGAFSGIALKARRKYYIAGNGIYYKYDIRNSLTWRRANVWLNKYAGFIEMNGYNRIITGGNEIWHYNGYSWKNMTQEVGISPLFLKSVKIKENTIVLVGDGLSNALIIMGKNQ